MIIKKAHLSVRSVLFFCFFFVLLVTITETLREHFEVFVGKSCRVYFAKAQSDAMLI